MDEQCLPVFYTAKEWIRRRDRNFRWEKLSREMDYYLQDKKRGDID